jgi:hypothetical protein
LIAWVYIMDIFAERGIYVEGRWVPVKQCEREGWCKPGRPEPKLFEWLFKRDEPPSYDWLCPYVTTCQAYDSAYIWDNEDGIVFGKMTAVRHDDDDPYFEEEP